MAAEPIAERVCPVCHGAGKRIAYVCPGFRRVEMPCPVCDSTGRVDQAVVDRIERGKALRTARLERRESLREAAERRGVSPAVLSQIELGWAPIPEDWQP